MKYAIRYYTTCRVLDVADEVIIKYTEKDPELIHFAENKIEENQRLVVDINEYQGEDLLDSISIFKAAMEKHKNFVIMTNTSNKYYIDLYEANIPYFFINGANSIDEIISWIAAGVSDIYVINELGFNLKKIANLCHAKDVKVRVFPNVAQSLSTLPLDDFKKFFIRPDDVDAYEDYVDVFEFWCPIDRQAVFYDIYTSKKWLGNLKHIIAEIEQPIDNRTIVPVFGEKRLDCGKRCSFGKCDICISISNLAKTLNDNDLYLKKEKEKNEDKVKFTETAMQDDTATTT